MTKEKLTGNTAEFEKIRTEALSEIKTLTNDAYTAHVHADTVTTELQETRKEIKMMKIREQPSNVVEMLRAISKAAGYGKLMMKVFRAAGNMTKWIERSMED